MMKRVIPDRPNSVFGGVRYEDRSCLQWPANEWVSGQFSLELFWQEACKEDLRLTKCWTEGRGLEPRHAARTAWPAIRNRAQYHCGSSPPNGWWTGDCWCQSGCGPAGCYKHPAGQIVELTGKVGFGPTGRVVARPTDYKSAPFNRSGTPPSFPYQPVLNKSPGSGCNQKRTGSLRMKARCY